MNSTVEFTFNENFGKKNIWKSRKQCKRPTEQCKMSLCTVHRPTDRQNPRDGALLKK